METAEGSKDCLICREPVVFRWTDTHGVAQCSRCGAPYTIYHYDDGHKRLDQRPLLMIKAEYIAPCREYWDEKKRPMPGGFSFDPGYEVSSAEDREAWGAWMAAFAKETA